MIGFQCSATVQPVFGRNALFQPPPSSSPGAVHQPSSTTPSYAPAPSSHHRSNSVLPPNLLDYFPEAGGDGLRVSWMHAVNSRTRLSSALLGTDMMMEADVSLAETTRYPIPIMAHPPMTMSDITLEDWLMEVVRSETCKGVKLDFKSTRVVEPAFRVLARHAEFLKGPLILNADILSGCKGSMAPVDAWTFLMLCRTRFPKSIISMGWTTQLEDGYKIGYSRESVDQMASLVKEYSLLQPVTFPVRAAMLKYSIGEFQRLLFQVPNSSLTLWGHPGDQVSLEDLFVFRKAFGPHQLFYDIPEDILQHFRGQMYRR